MVTSTRKLPVLLGFGYYKQPVYQPILKKKVQQKVPVLLRKDSPVYTKTSA